MKHEQSEKLFVEELYNGSAQKNDGLSKIKDVQRLTGDASTRRYYRIQSLTKSYVVCLDNPTDFESDFFQMQNILEENQVRVPHIYDGRKDKGYLLEEDLGDITLLSRLATCSKEEELALYMRAIDEVVKIHSIRIQDGKPYSSRYFDSEKLNQETNMTNEYFLRKYLKCSNETMISSIASILDKINSELAQEKQVVCHRDYHSRNLMLKDDEMIVIDFQDARLGPAQYDLVSLIDDCYYNLDADNKIALQEYYCKEMKIIKDLQFDRIYNLMLIQRTYKAIGSFCYIAETRGDNRYLKYVGRAFETVRNNLKKFPEFKELNEQLSKIYYES